MSKMNNSTDGQNLDLNVCPENGKTKKWGLIATGVVGGTLLALYAIATPFVTPAFRNICLPYVPATNVQIRNVLKMLMLRSGHLVDIGSGDGRVVIAAAKQGFQAVGYELNPWLVWYSRYRARREGVHQNAKFYVSDLWKGNPVQPENSSRDYFQKDEPTTTSWGNPVQPKNSSRDYFQKDEPTTTSWGNSVQPKN